MFRSFRHEFDPLDLEILERALNATWAAVKDNRNDPPADFDSNEGLETILKRELIETARFNGVSDPENSPRPTTELSCRRVPCLRANLHNALPILARASLAYWAGASSAAQHSACCAATTTHVHEGPHSVSHQEGECASPKSGRSGCPTQTPRAEAQVSDFAKRLPSHRAMSALGQKQTRQRQGERPLSPTSRRRRATLGPGVRLKERAHTKPKRGPGKRRLRD